MVRCPFPAGSESEQGQWSRTLSPGNGAVGSACEEILQIRKMLRFDGLDKPTYHQYDALFLIK
jgi:hypothetical protein